MTKERAPFIGGKMAPGDFIKALNDGSKPVARRFHGWAKASSVTGCIAFAPHANCSLWIDLAESAILDVEVVGAGSCGDHQHAEVWVTLASDGDASINAVCQLLSALQS